jgi:hypothetical protein
MYEYREVPMLNIHEELDPLLRRTPAKTIEKEESENCSAAKAYNNNHRAAG